MHSDQPAYPLDLTFWIAEDGQFPLRACRAVECVRVHVAVARDRLRLALVVQQRGEFDVLRRRGGAFERVSQCVIGVVLGRLLHSGARGERGEQLREQPQLVCDRQAVHEVFASHQTVPFVPLARRRQRVDIVDMSAAGACRLLFDAEPERGGKSRRTQDPHRVLCDHRLGVARRAQDLVLYVPHSAERIDDRPFCDVPIDGVASEISARRVLLRRRDEPIPSGRMTARPDRIFVAAERGVFAPQFSEYDRSRRDSAVRKFDRHSLVFHRLGKPFGREVGTDVEVGLFGEPPSESVPDRPSDRVQCVRRDRFCDRL